MIEQGQPKKNLKKVVFLILCNKLFKYSPFGSSSNSIKNNVSPDKSNDDKNNYNSKHKKNIKNVQSNFIKNYE